MTKSWCPKVPDVSWELLGLGSNRQDTYVFWGLLKWRPPTVGPVSDQYREQPPGNYITTWSLTRTRLTIPSTRWRSPVRIIPIFLSQMVVECEEILLSENKIPDNVKGRVRRRCSSIKALSTFSQGSLGLFVVIAQAWYRGIPHTEILLMTSLHIHLSVLSESSSDPRK